MTIVLRLKLYKISLSTARITYENTYDMREKTKKPMIYSRHQAS